MGNTAKPKKVEDIVRTFSQSGMVFENGTCFFGEIETYTFHMKAAYEWILQAHGICVANDEQEKSRWRKTLIQHKNTLSPCWLEYFSETATWSIAFDETSTWPILGEKLFREFPNKEWNKKMKIWNEQGILQTLDDFCRVLEGIGFTFVLNKKTSEGDRIWKSGKECPLSEGQKNESWQVESIEYDAYLEELKALNVLFINGKFDFWEIRWYRQKARIKPEIVALFEKILQGDLPHLKLVPLEDFEAYLVERWIPVSTQEDTQTRWRKEVEAQQKTFEKYGVTIENWVWYLDDGVAGDKLGTSLVIQGKKLTTFPSKRYNKSIDIESGELGNFEDIGKMLKSVWIPLASEAQKRERRKKILENNAAGLSQYWIHLIDGFWYFGEAHGYPSEMNIEDPCYAPKPKTLRNFPLPRYNQKHSLWSNEGVLTWLAHIYLVFEHFKMPLATPQMQIAHWKQILVENKEALVQANIFYNTEEDGWEITELKSFHNWPKIGHRNLMSFPHQDWNMEQGIWDARWVVQNPQELEKLCMTLWFKTLSWEKILCMRKKRYAQMLEKYTLILEPLGMIFDAKKTSWNISQSKWYNQWPKIEDRPLRHFPSREFNRENGLWDGDGNILSRESLGSMLKFLGFSVEK